jgi:hypothetical protein
MTGVTRRGGPTCEIGGMKKHVCLAFALLLSACYTSVIKQSDLSPEHKQLLAHVESYYLGKARDQAAFTLDCPRDQLTTKAVSTTPARISMIDDQTKKWVHIDEGEQIATIGAEGCGRRTAFLVMCGPRASYGSVNRPDWYPPCDVIPSSDGARVADKINRETHEVDEEARRHASETSSHH